MKKEDLIGGRAAGGIRWSAVLSGWAVAFLVGIISSTILRSLLSIFLEPPIARGELTLTAVIVSVASGFISYLIGGCVAARIAGSWGGKHGALAAVFGLLVGTILTIILALCGLVFTEGVAVPPVCFGLAGAAPAAGAILFAGNLFGGYVGGKLGEPYRGT